MLRRWAARHLLALACAGTLIALLTAGCAGYKPPNLDPCQAAQAIATAVCLAQPGTDPCIEAKATADAACGTHSPTCPLPGMSLDPRLWCGCWESSGRTNGEWVRRPDCAADCRTAGCPAGQQCVKLGETDPPVYVCGATPPPPACPPTCPAGTACSDPAKGCVPATPPPPTPGCSIDGQPGPPIEGYKNILGNDVNAALHALRPDCEVGARCVVQGDPQRWLAQVVERLRKMGLCAGQHEPGVTDEVAVAMTSTSAREGWHVYAGQWDAGDAARGTVVWSPQAARGAYAAPSPPPPPTCKTILCAPGQHCEEGKGCVADAPPPLAGDLAPLPDPSKGDITGHWQNDRADFTVRECGDPAHAAAYGFPGRRCYPLGEDLTPERMGRERYMMGDRTGSLAPPDAPNPYAVCNADGGARAEPIPDNWSQCVCVKNCTAATKLQFCRADGSLCSPWVSR